jgi:hypothetical protein
MGVWILLLGALSGLKAWAMIGFDARESIDLSFLFSFSFW